MNKATEWRKIIVFQVDAKKMGKFNKFKKVVCNVCKKVPSNLWNMSLVWLTFGG